MEFILEKLLGFTLVITRISAFFLIAPVFSWQSIPARFKVAITLLLAIFFSSIITLPFNTQETSIPQAVILLSLEAAYGLALGLVVTILFSAVKVAGRIVEREMGFAMAEILDPLTGEGSQPASSLLEMIFVLMFLSANGHHLFLLVVARSFETFPIGQIPTIELLTTSVTQAGSELLIAGLKIAAPMLAAFILLMIVLAVMAKIEPEMNILFLSLPLRVGLGLIMLAIFIPYISSFIEEFASKINLLLPI